MGNWESVEQSGDKNVNAWDKKSWVLLDGKATKDVAPSAPPLKDKTRTLIIVILDESGSMHTQKDDTIGSYNQLLADQREQCKEDEVRNMAKLAIIGRQLLRSYSFFFLRRG